MYMKTRPTRLAVAVPALVRVDNNNTSQFSNNFRIGKIGTALSYIKSTCYRHCVN